MTNNKAEDIYIDCQPVDEQGNTINEIQQNNGTSSSHIKLSLNNKTETILYSVGGVIGGIIMTFVLYKVGKHVMNKFKQ